MKSLLLAAALTALALSTLVIACGDADQSQLGIGSRTSTTLPDGTPAEGGAAEGDDDASTPADASTPSDSGADAVAKDAGGDAADAATAGKSLSAYTDATGSFFVRQTTATAAGIALPARVGARDAAITKLMTATIANGDCNSAACHGGAQGRVHVP